MNDIIQSSNVAFEIIASAFDMQTAKNEEELTNAFIKFLEAKGYKVTELSQVNIHSSSD